MRGCPLYGDAFAATTRVATVARATVYHAVEKRAPISPDEKQPAHRARTHRKRTSSGRCERSNCSSRIAISVSQRPAVPVISDRNKNQYRAVKKPATPASRGTVMCQGGKVLATAKATTKNSSTETHSTKPSTVRASVCGGKRPRSQSSKSASSVS